MTLVKLLTVLLCVLLSVVTSQSQTCPSSGMACYPSNCCAQYRICHDTTFYAVQPTAPGTVCKDGAVAWASECANTPCGAAADTVVEPTSRPPTQATTKPTPAPTPAATLAPTPKATVAPATPAPTPKATAAPATPAPTPKATLAPTPAATPAPTLAPTRAPTPAPTLAPTPATRAPTPAPTTSAPTTSSATSAPSGGSGFGQLLLAYYSGISLETVGSGGVNALALAFFDPTPLGSGTCDFTNPLTPCVKPAAGSGDAKNLQWALNVFSQATAQLSANTSPKRGGKPTIYFSFGGLSQGGACWDTLFGSATTAATFGRNAALLVTTVYNTIGKTAYVGFDLDVEETITALPYISNFIAAFRAIAPYDTFPLQLCTLSGLADPTNADHFKIGIMREVGPAQKGINFLNMMVANADLSCTGMQNYWMNPALDFIPPANKIFGMWGELLPSWILHEPGCTTGSSPLFPMMKQKGVGIGIWQWWSGATSNVVAVINQIRSG